MGATVLDKRRLFIIGAGSWARELESWLELIPDDQRDWCIAGYLEKERNALLGYPTDYQIVGYEDTFSFNSSDLAVIGIADPAIKERIYHKLKGKIQFFTFISPDAVVGKFNEIGEGAIICPRCVVTTNVSIGKLVTINVGAQVGHDVLIDDFSSIMPNVDIAGKCRLGKKAFVGMKATIIPQRKICDNAKIGAGSVVLRNIKDAKTVFGNPARAIWRKKMCESKRPIQ
jgi:sugar O-acyltransferase (sialic acid O-acetyltransferase NeuD family)